jgi:LAO/AO transport system kinase
LVDLKQMVTAGLRSAPASAWRLPVIGTSALTGEGLDALAAAIERHRRFALESKAGEQRMLAIAQFRLRKTAENLLLDRFAQTAAKASGPLAAQLARRDSDPYTLAHELLNTSLQEHTDEPNARPQIA